MKKVMKIALPILVLGVIAGVVFIFVPWGAAESEVVKTEVEVDSEQVQTEDSVIIYDINELNGKYVSTVGEKVTSEIMFEIEGLQETIGKFTEFSIELVANETGQNVVVIIDPSSVNTNNRMRDDGIRGEGFFEVEKFPEIRFESDNVELIEEKYVASGLLSMLGTEETVEVSFTYLGKGKNDQGVELASFQGDLLIDRTNHGMNETTSVGNDVKITFYTELSKVE